MKVIEDLQSKSYINWVREMSRRGIIIETPDKISGC